jgi:dienelactone hydrolase
MRRTASVLVCVVLTACGNAAPGSSVGGSESDGGGGHSTGPDAGSAGSDASSTGDSAPSGQGDASAPAPDAANVPDAPEGDATASGPGPYGSDGPHTVTTVTLQVPAPNGTFSTIAYVPSGSGPFPVVILSSGFFQPAAAYAPYATRLGSWGVLTFLRDDPNLGEGTPAIAADVSYMVTTWLAATNGASSGPLAGKIDASNVGLAGHSRGGQIALLAAEGGAHGQIKGVFGLDPVDQSMGSDPEARTTIATIGVPLAFIGETTDSGASSCAPAADNYQVLYGAAASPAVAITALGADHTMFEDPGSCFSCTLCTAGTASQPKVLAYSVRYLTAFFARQLLGDTAVGSAFTGAGATQDVASGVIQIVSK